MGCVISFTLQLLPSGRGPSIPIQKKAGWAPKLVWMFWRRGTFLLLLESNYDFSDVYLVTAPPPSHRLQYRQDSVPVYSTIDRVRPSRCVWEIYRDVYIAYKNLFLLKAHPWTQFFVFWILDIGSPRNSFCVCLCDLVSATERLLYLLWKPQAILQYAKGTFYWVLNILPPILIKCCMHEISVKCSEWFWVSWKSAQWKRYFVWGVVEFLSIPFTFIFRFGCCL